MKIHDVVQRSPEWLQMRAARFTASEFGQLFTAKLKPRKGHMPESYLHRKVAEFWTGGCLPGFGSSCDQEQGNLLEDEALPWLALEYGVLVEHPGFITADDDRVGCSPDGWIDGHGVEIKCPSTPVAIGYLLAGELPDEYAPQVYGSLWVTGAPQWWFVSYHRHCPPLVVKVQRDEAIMTRIGEGLTLFLDRFERAKARLIEINGGPPPYLAKAEARSTQVDRSRANSIERKTSYNVQKVDKPDQTAALKKRVWGLSLEYHRGIKQKFLQFMIDERYLEPNETLEALDECRLKGIVERLERKMCEAAIH